MKCSYSITFEFQLEPPITEKGISKGSSLRTIVARAVDDATTKNPNVHWTSVVVLIQRNSE
jgi:hypothetical protein